ncbi:MAG: SDR family oxidoreductase [Bacteroidetes bacterium]|nr:SDR family oxidoreductase [Bacteroidota bacterium]
MKNYLNLQGRTAFVTGGARGIGKAAALGLAESGADVAIVDIDLSKAEETAEVLRKTGSRTLAIKCDVTDPQNVTEMIQQIVKTWNRLDIAFNNAGICINTPALDMTFEEWNRVLDINLTGVFLTCQAAGRVMKEQQGGSIINTASMSGHIVNAPQPQCTYNASKAGVILLTKSLAVEWAPYNIRVNSISPGYIATEMTLSAPEEWKSRWNDLNPTGRMGTPEELVSAVVYLASDSASYTTGSDIVIDGAFTCI